ncbi:MAG: hypothetical protein ABI114_12265 [Rhodanobacter sp.]
MRLLSARGLLLPFCAVLLLTACHSNEPGASTPEAAIQGTVDQLKAKDFNALLKHALPPADYANLRADWQKREQDAQPITAEDRVKFSAALQKFTAPNAETELYTELQPKLDAMQKQYSDQLPVLLKMGTGFLKNGVAENQRLSAAQKAQAESMLDVLGPWAQKTSWFDQAKAKQAVGVAVATARKLDLKGPDQLRTMDFDTAMTKYSLGFAGAKQLLQIYGLSLDDTLKSVKVHEVSKENGHAVVKISYTLLGKPLSAESKLVQQDGRWYSEDLLNDVRKSHAQLSAPATAASAPIAVQPAITPTAPTPAKS